VGSIITCSSKTRWTSVIIFAVPLSIPTTSSGSDWSMLFSGFCFWLVSNFLRFSKWGSQKQELVLKDGIHFFFQVLSTLTLSSRRTKWYSIFLRQFFNGQNKVSFWLLLCKTKQKQNSKTKTQLPQLFTGKPQEKQPCLLVPAYLQFLHYVHLIDR